MVSKSKSTSTSQAPGPQPCPWLMFSHGRRSSTQTFYSISDGRYYVKKIPELSHNQLCASSHGWLVMLNHYSDDCFLLNPVSMKKIKLPPLESISYSFCLLTSPPIDPTCIIVFGLKDRPHIIFCRPGEKEWTQQEFGSQGEMPESGAVVCNGKIYGLTSGTNLVTLEVVDGQFEVRHIGGGDQTCPILPDVILISRYLIESCGDVFLIYISYFGERGFKVRDIDLYKMDFSKSDWVKVESLGDRAFFVSATSRNNCISCSATEANNIQGNSVYLTLGKGDTSMYVFDIEEKSMFISVPCPNVVHNLSQTEWVALVD